MTSLIAVIGGSGLYSLLDDAEERTIDTPFGPTSDAVTVGALGGREVAFLPRHGKGHRFPPHKVNYRANLWALESLGARRVVGVNAVGSLRPEIPPGSLVVPDQIVDRTYGREQTFFDGPGVAHASFSDPYCPIGRGEAVTAAASAGWTAVDGGTQVVIPGPRFSTRAESVWYSAQGWSIIGMTAHPEVILARELGLCYLPLCLVTDYDAGVQPGEGVTHEEVLAAFSANLERVRAVLGGLVGAMADEPNCPCASLKPELM
ncbi:purine nucleoside phosphorylase [Actinorhabdospora filicis]|uniref:Purine nucleoside phosphorylase n=1 Tax=Actinorhabdospora filicis TaxID=1785913 RepID=A0A9W6SHS5_9ACTN|nr:S-methyl-5'-thioadenosine phosphorylase [Actinorhabdospora filicis]GLZ76228.1 purine nucleoside phosphorylase [Actinorhabdospora filicis]